MNKISKNLKLIKILFIYKMELFDAEEDKNRYIKQNEKCS